jgi:putative cell wall-binding protein
VALRFHTATANRGDHALEVVASTPDAATGTAPASQCVRWATPRTCSERVPVGEFIQHADHDHMHFGDFALYELRLLDSHGQADMSSDGLVAGGGKASFCLVDSEADRGGLEDPFTRSYYAGCTGEEGDTQGISPGWRDVYLSTLADQQIPLDGVGDGTYALVVTVDPDGRLREADDSDNVAGTTVRLSADATRLTVIEQFDGDPTDDVRSVARQVCHRLVDQPGQARGVVLARDDVFTDALAGAPLAGDDACILYTAGGGAPLDRLTRVEIDRALPDGGPVWILGGVDAVSAEVEEELRTAGYAVRRLAGATRYETAVEIAHEVRAANPDRDEVLLAWGEDFPDAVTGGAYGARVGIPILLTPTDHLHPATAAAITAFDISRTVVLGGATVISDQTVAAAPGSQRVAGANRMGTATQVADVLWADEARSIDTVSVVNLEHPDGWAHALAVAPLAARHGMPVLGVASDRYPAETAAFLQGFDRPAQAVTLVGSDRHLAPQVVSALLGDVGR